MTRTVSWPIGLLVVVVSFFIGVGISEVASGSDESDSLTCARGTWPVAQMEQPNGDTLNVSVRRSLPEGYTYEASSDGQRISVDSEGRVRATGGEVKVTCIAPTK